MMYSEMIIEFERGQQSGSAYFSGRAAALLAGREEDLLSASVWREEIVLRSPEGWEKEFFRRQLVKIRPSATTGPPLLGEEKTLWIWREERPGWIEVETEEEDVIDFLGSWPWAATLRRCYRPDSRTVSFLLPSALLGVSSCAPA